MRKKELPVYLFTGFLESGKTSCLEETLQGDMFEDGQKTLFLLCEEGEVELDTALLDRNAITQVVVEEESQMTRGFLLACQTKYCPDRILIEYNGTWDMRRLFDEILPVHWIVAQVFTTIDATTYETYFENMRQMMMSQVSRSDLVIFNRCTEQTNRKFCRRSVKGMNPRAQIIYEMTDGSVEQASGDDLPYNADSSIILLEDEDYGLFYIDSMDHPERYEGKEVIFKGQVFTPDQFPANAFVPGRFAMTCCADDVTFIGYMCHYDRLLELKEKSWVMVRADVKVEYRKEYGCEGVVLYASTVEPAEQPETELVYFT